jgi:hypothetical protein
MQMGDNRSNVDLGVGRSALFVSVGLTHSCAVLDNATIKCWGENTSGILGIGHSNHLGNDAHEMGKYLPSISLATH